MDKNKSRTDMLAAGRKKLQQYRKKKDGKGNKKSGKSEQDADADAAATAVNLPDLKPPNSGGEGSGKQPVSAGERSGYDLTQKHVDTSSLHSTDNSVVGETGELTSEIGKVEASLPKVVELQPEAEESREMNQTPNVCSDQEAGSSGQNKAEISSDMDTGTAEKSSSEILEMVGSEVKPRHVSVSPVNLFSASDTGDNGGTDDGDIAVKHAQGADQVPDIGAIQEAEDPSSEKINKSMEAEFKGYKRVSISGSDGIAEADTGADVMRVNMGGLDEIEHDLSVSEGSATEAEIFRKYGGHSDSTKHNSHDVFTSDGSSIEIKEVQKVDEHTVSCKSVTLPDDGSAASEVLIAEYMMVGSSNREKPKTSLLWSAESDNDVPSKMISWADGNYVSLSQLAEVVQGLSEEEFSFLLSARKLTSQYIAGSIGQGPGLSDVLETLKEQLYLTSFVKDMHQIIHVDIDHQHLQLVNEISVAAASLNEARLKNESLELDLRNILSELQLANSQREDLQKESHFVKAELEEISTRYNEIQCKLVMSQKELGNALTDLADCRNQVAALQTDKENMSENLTSVIEERDKFAEENANSIVNVASIKEAKLKLEEEKDSYLDKYRKASIELADYKALAESLQLEKENLKGILVSFTEEQDYSIHETEKLSTEVTEYKDIVETLQQEISNLNKSLALIAEERKELTEEKDKALCDREKLSAELDLYKSLTAGKQLECDEAINNLKEAALHLEQLTEENLSLTSAMDLYKAKIEESEMKKSSQSANDQVLYPVIPDMEKASLGDHDSYKILSSVPGLNKSLSDDGKATCSPMSQLKLDGFDGTNGFVSFRGQVEQAGKVLQKLEKAIEEMQSHADSVKRSSTKGVAPAVSKLIQAYESKSQADDHEAEGVPSAEEQTHVDPYILTKEQTGKLRTILDKLSVDAENANELFKVEKNGKVIADFAYKELKDQYNALQGEIYDLGEAKIELLVLYELIRQHVCNVEAKKDELFLFYDTLRQQNYIAKAENNELVNRLSAYKSRMSDMLGKLDELHQNSSEMNSSIHIQMEMLHKEVSDRTLILEKEWTSVISWLSNAVKKLNMHIETGHTNYLTDTDDNNNIESRVVASFEGAARMIDDLKEKLDVARSDYVSTCSTYNDLTEKFNNLHGQHEVATGLLHKIYASLKELVSDSSVYVEEDNAAEIESEKLVDPLNLIIEQLRRLLEERLLLKSSINQINLDLTDKTNKIEELSYKCFSGDAIMRLVKQVEDIIDLKGFVINMDEPASFIESLTYLLVEKLKEANDVAILCRENIGARDKKFSELDAQVDNIISMFVHCDNESVVYKESLKSAVEDLLVLQSQILQRVTEVEQSEQRVSSLREKLSIAVAKGKGLIVQRDGLKQLLADKSSELERCLQELQSKDTQLLEVETKLKTYSEAGERVEALESELSYIRNSATALRESFLLKDSALHRIEEILEDLELPEHFHARDIIEKIDWLASAVTGNPLPTTDWDQKSGAGEGPPHMDGWKEEMPPHSDQEHELTKKYDDLESKFYALAEQNEMLEQSLMERNNLVQRWEEILDKINMPSQLRSMEPEDRIEWLGGALSEAVHRCESLQQNIDNVETFCKSLSNDLEESRRKTSSLEAALQSVTDEKEHLSTNLDILSRDNDIVSQKAEVFEGERNKLQHEVTVLQDKLKVLQGIEELNHHVDSEIRRLQDLLSGILQDRDSEEENLGTTSIEYLEQLLKKLVQKYSDLSAREVVPAVAVEHMSGIGSAAIGEKTLPAYFEDQEVSTLNKQLKEASGDLTRAKEDIVTYVEKNETLIHELERLEAKKLELQELLNQEEQKSASFREKLNMAVRKGKSLVQQRDSMRQTIDELTNDAERIRSELSMREASLLEYEQKIKDYQERIEGVESKGMILENQLAESERDRQDKNNTLGAICGALVEIDVGLGYDVVDPLNKIVEIGKVLHGLQAVANSSENEANKSKRAAELLLAELNEVQERNDGLLEELEKANTEISDLAKEIFLAETAKHNAILQVENLKALLTENRNNQSSEFAELKPCVYQLRSTFSDFTNFLGDAFSKDLELVHNLTVTAKSYLKSFETGELVSLGTGGVSAGIGQAVPGNEVANVREEFHSVNSAAERTKDQSKKITQSEICEFVESNLQELMMEISGVKEKLFKHASSLREEAKSLSETMGSVHKEMTSQHEYLESSKGEMFLLESNEKQKDTEIIVLRRDVSLLYEACKSSVAEIRNWKDQQIRKGLIVQDHGFNYDSASVLNEGLSEHTISTSEGFLSRVADELVLAVKEIVSSQNENVELSQMELKTEITNLQTELQEKNIQKDKICFDLVNQIKEAESTAIRYSQELQSANEKIHNLERRIDVLERDGNTLQKMLDEEQNKFQQKAEELKNQEATYIELQERVRSLTDVVAAKEQEAEAVMQALDEEETQMEVLKNKNEELETVLHQKCRDLVNAEASLGKASKKLAVTVSKFDELHYFSESLLSEIEKLQSQLHDRDSEVSFLRQEVTRCTNDAIAASQMSKNRNSDEIHDLLSWLDPIVSQVLVHNRYSDDKQRNQDHEYKEILQKRIMAIITELEDQRTLMQSKDNLLRLERTKVEDLLRKRESLEKILQEKESQLTTIRGAENSGQGTNTSSESIETESVANNWPVPGASSVSQVRSLRKSNNDQVAISVDMEPGSGRKLEDEDDDKAHGFKSLTTSKVVPRFTRPVTDLVDGLWVSCDRALMRQPALRLGVIMYWVILHALIATFAV